MATMVRRPHSASAPCLSSPSSPGLESHPAYQKVKKDDGESIDSEVYSPTSVTWVLTKLGRGLIRVSTRKIKPERPIIEHTTLAQDISEEETGEESRAGYWNKERLEVVYEREKDMLRHKRRLSQDQQCVLLRRQKETIEEAIIRARQERENMRRMLVERQERIGVMEARLEQVKEEMYETEAANEGLRESLGELEMRKKQLDVEVAEKEKVHATEKRNAEKMMSDFLRLESEKADMYAQLQAIFA